MKSLRLTSLSLLALLAAQPAPAAKATSPKAFAAKSSAAKVLPFITDDYDQALAMARARKLPLFIENWAPW